MATQSWEAAAADANELPVTPARTPPYSRVRDQLMAIFRAAIWPDERELA
jgi:hypothetical protein